MPPSNTDLNENFLKLQAARDAALKAARRAVRDTTRLTRLLAVLTEPGTTEMLLDKTLSTLSELFIADIIVLLDPIGTGTLTPLASIGLPEHMRDKPFSYPRNGCLYQVMMENNAVQLQCVAACTALDARFEELQVNIAACFPVCGEHAVRGILVVARCCPEVLADPEMDLLSTMAYRIGLTLDDAQRQAQLAHIIQSGNTIGSYLDKYAIASAATRYFPPLVGADSGAILLREPGASLHFQEQFGLSDGSAGPLTQLAKYLVSKGKVTTGKPYCSADKSLLQSFGIISNQNYAIQALLAIPICHQEAIIGIIIASRCMPFLFNGIALQMGSLYANYLSVAFENARLYQIGKNELVERIKAVEALHASDERLRALIRSVSDIIMIISTNGLIQYSSPASEYLWNISASNIQGSNIIDYVIESDKKQILELLFKAETQTKSIDLHGVVHLIKTKTQSLTYEVTLVNLLHEPAVNGIVVTFHDVTERNLYENELAKLAFQDPLTGLANRAHFMELLNGALVHTASLGQSVAVFFFDLDGFKQVNDTLGHACGDEVLRTVADRVRSCLRKNDTAARFGGDEFTFLIEGISTEEEIVPVAERLLLALQTPMKIDDKEVHIGGSIGIALGHPNKDNRDTILHKADLAMYQAKKRGGGNYIIFQSKM